MNTINTFDELVKFISPELEISQETLADVIKMLLHEKSQSLFEKLDFYNDSIFLEPLLFTKLQGLCKTYSLDQILYGYLSKDSKPERINVFIEKNNYVYLPNIGFLELLEETGTSFIDLVSDKEGNFNLDFKGKKVDYKLNTLQEIENTEILVLPQNITPLDSFFKNANNEKIEKVEIQNTVNTKISFLNKAFEINQQHFKEHHNLIRNVGRMVVLFNNNNVRSFAAKPIHGVGFFSVWEDNCEIFFFVELAHQFDHNILNSITTEANDYFKIDINTPLKDLNGNQYEQRTFFNALHGLHETAMIGTYLERLYDKQIFYGINQHEILCRLSDNQDRHLTGLHQILNLNNVFTKKGLQLYELLHESCNDIMTRKGDLINSFRIDDKKPFVFNHDFYLKHHPYNN